MPEFSVLTSMPRLMGGRSRSPLNFLGCDRRGNLQALSVTSHVHSSAAQQVDNYGLWIGRLTATRSTL
jgi:hypothetical protein